MKKKIWYEVYTISDTGETETIYSTENIFEAIQEATMGYYGVDAWEEGNPNNPIECIYEPRKEVKNES